MHLPITPGVKNIADTHGAYWLIDAIASYQTRDVLKACGWMQIWTLEVRDDHTATLTCRRDTGLPAVVTQDIEFTDFPAAESPVKLWVCDGTLLTPSEY